MTVLASRQIKFVDLTTSPLQVIGALSLPDSPSDVSIGCASFGIGLVVNSGVSAIIHTVDISSQSLIGSVTLPAPIHTVEVTPDGSTALVGTLNPSTLRVLTISSTGVLADSGQSIPVEGPDNIAISPSGRQALVAGLNSSEIGVIDINGTAVTRVQRLRLGHRPVSLAFDPSGARAYVLNCESTTVNVLDTSIAGTVSHVADLSLPSPSFCSLADQIAVTADGARLLVRRATGLSIFDAATGSLLMDLSFVGDTGGGGIATLCHGLSAPTAPPVAFAGLDQVVECTSVTGATVTLDGSGSADPDGTTDIVSYEWSKGSISVGTGITVNTPLELGTHLITLTVTDSAGKTDSDTVQITIQDTTAPVITILTPASGHIETVGNPVVFTANIVEACGLQNAVWELRDFDGHVTSSSATICVSSGSIYAVDDLFSFSAAGIYSVTLVVTDASGNESRVSVIPDAIGGHLPAFVVIYDPEGGFVTGGGWIWSPEGVFHPQLAEFAIVTGKATFGFVAKYLNGANVPTGNTEFQFKAGDLNFKSTAYEWLIVAGKRAQYKGWGTINGDAGFQFMLTGIDGDLGGGDGNDRLRMKIWVGGTGEVIYDNKAGAPDDVDSNELTILGGGNVVVHKD